VCASKAVGHKPGALTLSYLGLYSWVVLREGLRIDSLMLGVSRGAGGEPSSRGALGIGWRVVAEEIAW